MASLIEDYALLGDTQSAALVGRNGSIDWLCLPRFDSPACFAALLGDLDAGFWRIAPSGGGPCAVRRYRNDSLVLESEWDTAEGSVRVIDTMPPRGEAADVVRVVEGLRGRVSMQMVLRLRFDYGHIVPWIRKEHQQLVGVAGPDAVWLHTPVETYGQDKTTYADFTVAAGERVPFVLTHALSYQSRPQPVEAESALLASEKFWAEWLGRLQYDGEWPDAVRQSMVVLKALTYAPTGGIVAAVTTSLPEEIGGDRNWDYRYCWLRDAAFTLQALLGTGFAAEARAWREWLLRAVAGDPADLQIMYGLDGTRRLPEHQLGWLSGYEGSAPVRTGNAASQQLQLDVWGEVLDTLHLSREAGLAPDESAWDVQQKLLDFLEGHWDDPDNSLWEVRGPRRPFVHSKVLAWAGVNRGVQAVERFQLAGPVDRWKALQEQIHTDVCRHGFDADRNTFTQFYGSRGLDAALLLIPQVGFLPWDDDRVIGTVAAVERDLDHAGLLLRYRPDQDGGVDGLAGQEGAFLVCNFWLVDALQGTGQTARARALFQRLLDLRNDVGLLSEEYDPVNRRHLGNTPQALSHVGLVNSARRLNSPPGHGIAP